MKFIIPGFIVQLKGILTKKRYRAATIFVEYTTRLGYVHFQKGLISGKTVDSKKAFEDYAFSQGMLV